MNIHIHVYDSESLREQWLGYIEPEDKLWTLFIPSDGGEPFLSINR